MCFSLTASADDPPAPPLPQSPVPATEAQGIQHSSQPSFADRYHELRSYITTLTLDYTRIQAFCSELTRYTLFIAVSCIHNYLSISKSYSPGSIIQMFLPLNHLCKYQEKWRERSCVTNLSSENNWGYLEHSVEASASYFLSSSW